MYPTRVGMNRDPRSICDRGRRVPHACGDEPEFGSRKRITESVPHARGDGPMGQPAYSNKTTYALRVWGRTNNSAAYRVTVLVYPTYVGMNRWYVRTRVAAGSTPQPWDEPTGADIMNPLDKCTPRVWG